MLFGNEVLAGIGAGEVTVAFRSWKRPTVREGGTLRTAVGVLHIDELTPIDVSEITEADARAAGFESPDAVVSSLRTGDDRRVYRVRFHLGADDPRRELREQDSMSAADVAEIDAQLDRWDRASRDGPWTRSLLTVIAERPAERSLDLAAGLDIEQQKLKRRVRQLKELGLTESLETGYRLSPRGQAYRRRRG